MVNDLINERMLWLLSLIVSIILTDRCIRKYYVERVKKFVKGEAIPTNYLISMLIFKLRAMDVIFILLVSLIFSLLYSLGLIGNLFDPGWGNLLTATWFGGALICSLANTLMEARQHNSYLILELLNDKGELSIDEFTAFSNSLLKGERFYFALKPLLQTEMVSSYYEGTLTEDKVLYQITAKGKANYKDHLILESEKLEEEMFKIRAKVKRGIGNPSLLQMQHEQIFDKLLSTRKKITS